MTEYVDLSIDALANALGHGLEDYLSKLGYIIRKVDAFSSHALCNRIILITYAMSNTSLWKPRWARQCRGVILYQNDEGVWNVVSYMFQRGAEVLTGFHKANELDETENVSATNIGIFDDIQQETMNKLANNEEIDGVLSAKHDGSLMRFTYYTGEIADYLKDAISASNCTFAKTIMAIAEECGCPFLPIISSQNTIITTDDATIKYFTTAIFADIEGLSDMSVSNAWMQFGKKFMMAMKLFYERTGASVVSMEAVCANRRCAWGYDHPELCINYPVSSICVLSYSIGLNSFPHPTFSDIVHEVGLKEPVYWNITHTEQIDAHLKMLEMYIRRQVTAKEYFETFPPANSYEVAHTLEEEGYVFYSIHNGKYNYNKIKTPAYYGAHKRRNQNISLLIEIGNVSVSFPIAVEIARIFHEFSVAFVDIAHTCRQMLITENADRIRLFEVNKRSAKERFPDLELIQQFKMLVSTQEGRDYMFNLFVEKFPRLAKTKVKNEVVKTIREIIFASCPWDANCEEHARECVASVNPNVEKFYRFLSQIKISERAIKKFEHPIVFGCQHSTDIDVALITYNRKDLKATVDIDYLKTQLEELGYDTTREIDYNIIYVEGGFMMEAIKGGKETQNIILATYNNHRQMCPCPFTELVDVCIIGKIRITAKNFLDKMIYLTGKDNYKPEKKARKKAYEGTWARVEYMEDKFDLVQRTSDDPQLKTCLKALTMKMIQVILLEYNQFEYNKIDLANKISAILDTDPEHAMWFLFRGTTGEYNEEFWSKLTRKFFEIVHVHKPVPLTWTKLDMDISENPTGMPDECYEEFKKDPLYASDKFVQIFNEECAPNRLGDHFLIRSNNVDKLPPWIIPHIIPSDQRSEEWLDILNGGFYVFGNNTGIKKCDGPDWIKFYYNLIRGSTGELMIIQGAKFEAYHNVTVGFLLEEPGVKGSKGMAPDMLLTDGNEVIPVEIKVIVGPNIDNGDYRRAVHIATSQLESAKKVCRSDKAILIFMFIYILDGKFTFDVQYTYV